MIQAGNLPVEARRWTPWIYSIDFTGIDFTGATMQAQVRVTKDASGAPLIDLTAASAGSEGISFSVASGTTTVVLQIDETTMEGLPGAPAVGDDVVLAWDLQITPSGGTKAVYLEGPFTILAGVTH